MKTRNKLFFSAALLFFFFLFSMLLLPKRVRAVCDCGWDCKGTTASCKAGGSNCESWVGYCSGGGTGTCTGTCVGSIDTDVSCGGVNQHISCSSATKSTTGCCCAEPYCGNPPPSPTNTPTSIPTAACPPDPLPPTNVHLNCSSSQATLSWTAPSTPVDEYPLRITRNGSRYIYQPEDNGPVTSVSYTFPITAGSKIIGGWMHSRQYVCGDKWSASVEIPFCIVPPPPNPVPDCTSISGPTSVSLGSSGTYTVSHQSSAGNLKGRIAAGQSGIMKWWPAATSLPGITGTTTYTWTPTIAGTYDVFGVSYNDDIAECRGNANYLPSGVYLCNGSCSMRVTVIPPTPTPTPTPIQPTLTRIPTVTVKPLSPTPTPPILTRTPTPSIRPSCSVCLVGGETCMNGLEALQLEDCRGSFNVSLCSRWDTNHNNQIDNDEYKRCIPKCVCVGPTVLPTPTTNPNYHPFCPL